MVDLGFAVVFTYSVALLEESTWPYIQTGQDWGHIYIYVSISTGVCHADQTLILKECRS